MVLQFKKRVGNSLNVMQRCVRWSSFYVVIFIKAAAWEEAADSLLCWRDWSQLQGGSLCKLISCVFPLNVVSRPEGVRQTHEYNPAVTSS